MNKNDINNKDNKWLVVPRKTFIDKIKDFFGSIIKIFKPEITINDIKENIKDEIESPLQVEINKEDVEIIEQVEEKVDKQLEEQIVEKESKKEIIDNSYYKTLYNNMNSGKITIDDLSPSEFITIMKMQKIEHEFTLKKLEQAMNDYQSE